MIPYLPDHQECPYCDSPKWAGNPYKHFACGTQRNSAFRKRTDECKRLESQKLVREAISQVFQTEREAIKQVIRSLAIEVLKPEANNNPDNKNEIAV